MTRIPSRYMPQYNDDYSIGFTTPRLIDALLIGIIITLLAYLLWIIPPAGIIATGVICIGYLSSYQNNKDLQEIASKRPNEDIGTFAWSLDYRNIDTWVIRAVYEAFSEWFLTYKHGVVPLRASDKIGGSKLLPMDNFDFEDITEIILKRTNRTEENLEENPYYHKLYTVKDYIYFIDAQPKLKASLG